MQNATKCEDAVTTRQDMCETRRDVPARMKPSRHVPGVWVECQTRGCERSCWSGG